MNKQTNPLKRVWPTDSLRVAVRDYKRAIHWQAIGIGPKSEVIKAEAKIRGLL